MDLMRPLNLLSVWAAALKHGVPLAQVLLSLNREYEIKLSSVDALAMDKLSSVDALAMDTPSLL
jgi:hypothetical protein